MMGCSNLHGWCATLMATQVKEPLAVDTKLSSSTFDVSAVDPADIPETMTRPQLEWWILFTIAVAGKTAKQIEKKMRAFFDPGLMCKWNPPFDTPFKIVQLYIRQGHLARELRRVKIGKYRLLNA